MTVVMAGSALIRLAPFLGRLGAGLSPKSFKLTVAVSSQAQGQSFKLSDFDL